MASFGGSRGTECIDALKGGSLDGGNNVSSVIHKHSAIVKKRSFLSSGPVVHWSIGPVVHWSIGPLVQWSIGPLVLCQPSYFCLNLSTFIDLFSKLISLWFACHDCITPPLQYNTAKPCSSFSLHIILSLRPYSCTEDVLFPTPARGS